MADPASDSPATIRQRMRETLDRETLPPRGYREEAYLRTLLEAGFLCTEIATAHEVSERTITRAAARNDIDVPQPPSWGPARRLWQMDPDAIGGDA